VVLSWTVSGADDGVELSESNAGGDPQTFPAGTSSTSVTAQDELYDYELVALCSGARSAPKHVRISTHADGEVVSAHAQVTAADGDLLDVEWTFQDASGNPLGDNTCTITAENGTSQQGVITGGVLKTTVPAGRLVIEIDGHILAVIDAEADGADGSTDGGADGSADGNSGSDS